MARVSVIVPAFNAAATLPVTLGSVLAQTYTDWELIVVDDGSVDGTAEIAAAWSPRVQVVGDRVNRGPAGARNLGIKHAAGELVAFLDHDDRWLPNYLGSQVHAYDAAQRKYGNVGVVACDAALETATGTRLPHTYRDLVPFPASVTVETLLDHNPIYASALIPADVIRAVGGLANSTWGSDDHDLWLKVVENGFRIVDNPEVLAVYRVSPSSLSADQAKMARTNQATYRLALERGRLTPRQRRLARRKLRLNEAIECMERLLHPRDGNDIPPPKRDVVHSIAVIATVVVAHPRRWRKWLQLLTRGRTPWYPSLHDGPRRDAGLAVPLRRHESKLRVKLPPRH
jgi:glycosyltransferase involved in cell wall biosynthesis